METLTSAKLTVPDLRGIAQDLSALAAMLRSVERMERMAATVRLLLVVYSVERHGYDAVWEVLTHGLQYSDYYAADIIRTAVSIGEDHLAEAIRRDKPLSFAQWQAIAESGAAQREELIGQAAEYDLPPAEIAAHATGRDAEDVAAERALKALAATLDRVDRLGLRERAMDILAQRGYVQRVITNRR